MASKERNTDKLVAVYIDNVRPYSKKLDSPHRHHEEREEEKDACVRKSVCLYV